MTPTWVSDALPAMLPSWLYQSDTGALASIRDQSFKRVLVTHDCATVISVTDGADASRSADRHAIRRLNARPQFEAIQRAEVP